ncbi:3'-5' exonuclease [Acidithiobacillus albertensis]|uniref:3'-5' exonuclease n=1 Tax=Acidithiobacillus albertensis TaxID=119978 RepID=UPI00094B17C2|nr:3'-5' exonuclease [Acidithiobacillus albertensis]
MAEEINTILQNILVFDIETIPDISGGRRLHGIDLADDAGVAELLQHQRRIETQGASEFLRPYLHQVVAISALWWQGDQVKLSSFGAIEDPEATLVHAFFQMIQRHAPQLVSWNGAAFDLPVLHYRAFLHGIPATRYWEQGQNEPNYRWNNYTSRYHERHLDLMDVLSAYQARNVVRLQDMALLLGLPGKLGMSGAEVLNHYQQGEKQAIRQYCEVDVLNTALLHLRFELTRGHLDKLAYEARQNQLRSYLQGRDEAHIREFLDLWPENLHVAS